MPAFFLVVVLYTTTALGLTVLVLGDWQHTLAQASHIAFSIVRTVFDTQSQLFLLAIPALWWFWRDRFVPKVRPIVIAAVAAIVLQIGFFFLKGIIPNLVPFYADPLLASLDRALLFGHDAWSISHAITPLALVDWFHPVYATLWSFVAFVFPVVVVASDSNSARVQRYLWLYFLSWLVAGNIIALAASSVGPVYYDQLLGTNRFEEMRASFQATGYAAGEIAQLQTSLWTASAGKLSLISAFPSMHVAMATIVSLYLRERFRPFRLVGDAYFGVILLISVYSGYHYLLDGLASLIIVLALDAILRRVSVRRDGAISTPASDPNM